MNFREEIIELTLDNFHYNDRKISIEQFSDEILSKIEKRIDSKIEQVYQTATELEMDWTIRDKIIRQFIDFKEMLNQNERI